MTRAKMPVTLWLHSHEKTLADLHWVAQKEGEHEECGLLPKTPGPESHSSGTRNHHTPSSNYKDQETHSRQLTVGPEIKINLAFGKRLEERASDTKEDIEVPHTDYKIQIKLKQKSTYLDAGKLGGPKRREKYTSN